MDISIRVYSQDEREKLDSAIKIFENSLGEFIENSSVTYGEYKVMLYTDIQKIKTVLEDILTEYPDIYIYGTESVDEDEVDRSMQKWHTVTLRKVPDKASNKYIIETRHETFWN